MISALSSLINDTARASVATQLLETFFQGNMPFTDTIITTFPTNVANVNPTQLAEAAFVTASTLGSDAAQNNLFLQKAQDLEEAAFELDVAGTIINAFA